MRAVSKPPLVNYKNARYVGILSKEKRHGSGVVVDDDLTLCFSQWIHGGLNGLTLFYFSDASYIYGTWKQNQPHGLICFRNQHFLLYAYFKMGQAVGEAIAISFNHLYVFDSRHILSKQNKLQITHFQTIRGLFEVTNIKRDICIQPFEASLLGFMEEIAKKHNREICFIKEENRQYFGAKGGLGIRFVKKGGHKLQVLSIGEHEGSGGSIVHGAKYYQNRCVEEGNFENKETITYNKLAERPKDKVYSIYKKNHKKGMVFVNQYFQCPTNLLYLLNTLLNDKLAEATQKALNNKSLEKNKKISIEKVSKLEKIYIQSHRKSLKKTYQNQQSPQKQTKFKDLSEKTAQLKRILTPIYRTKNQNLSANKLTKKSQKTLIKTKSVKKSINQHKVSQQQTSPQKKPLKKIQSPQKSQRLHNNYSFTLLANKRYNDQLQNELKIRQQLSPHIPKRQLKRIQPSPPFFYKNDTQSIVTKRQRLLKQFRDLNAGALTNHQHIDAYKEYENVEPTARLNELQYERHLAPSYNFNTGERRRWREISQPSAYQYYFKEQ